MLFMQSKGKTINLKKLIPHKSSDGFYTLLVSHSVTSKETWFMFKYI